MSFELEGKLIEKFDTVEVSEKFKKREFVIEKTETNGGRDFTEQIKFQVVQDKCDLLDNHKVGDTVAVSFNVKGRSWTNAEGKVAYFNNLDAWRIVKPDGTNANDSSESSNSQAEKDDLPF